jgi:hypothetical protein
MPRAKRQDQGEPWRESGAPNVLPSNTKTILKNILFQHSCKFYVRAFIFSFNVIQSIYSKISMYFNIFESILVYNQQQFELKRDSTSYIEVATSKTLFNVHLLLIF